MRVSITYKRRMEDSEHWRGVERIEAGHSITGVALFFGVHHSVISQLWKHFQTIQRIVTARNRPPKGYNPRRRLIYPYFSQAES